MTGFNMECNTRLKWIKRTVQRRNGVTLKSYHLQCNQSFCLKFQFFAFPKDITNIFPKHYFTKSSNDCITYGAKNGLSKICGRQPLKNVKGYSPLYAHHIASNFSKAVFHKFYLVHS